MVTGYADKDSGFRVLDLEFKIFQGFLEKSSVSVARLIRA